MFIFRFVFVVFNLIARAMWSQNIVGISANPVTTPSLPGTNTWCSLYKNNRWHPAAPSECCDEKHQCKVYVDSHSTKYGITNNGPWAKRHCECDMAFHKCMIEKLPYDTMNIYFETMRMTCLVNKACPEDKPCENEYETMNFGNYRSRFEPEDEDE